ncbi:hypothetical protein GLAREA_09754 [Glarea lozoyensis ATCC 20868]|uniref:Uncharacterized protein n=1 Tax=Glarea lozoyensis (strain ATCC 20868 / MF5171) TaxID=1116229 RepID=S3DQ70_GLAL2|nr:uncharacterized protein GLAREA_09754 [Glarea lozoyensis ATCC 20868]EPE28633.1 hypothetical protein GLAREA_09754 [Glarea lozoyensis ATCC 20868]
MKFLGLAFSMMLALAAAAPPSSPNEANSVIEERACLKARKYGCPCGTNVPGTKCCNTSGISGGCDCTQGNNQGWCWK